MAKQATATGQQTTDRSSAHGRVTGFDVIRGFSVISMVLFHLCYDLKFIYTFNLPWFAPPFQDIWRASISWTFLFVAGCMCSFSRNGFKRALRYLAVAAAVFVATSVVAVDAPISFGIIFCMGASTLIAALLERWGVRPSGRVVALVLFVLFIISRGVPLGYVGLGTLRCALPRALYATPYFSFLGLPGPGFISSDYYPLVPYTLMYFVGVSWGHWWQKTDVPNWLCHLSCKPLEWVGHHALPIYVIHQPLILAVLGLVC